MRFELPCLSFITALSLAVVLVAQPSTKEGAKAGDLGTVTGVVVRSAKQVPI
jgi:hypothetical protein